MNDKKETQDKKIKKEETSSSSPPSSHSHKASKDKVSAPLEPSEVNSKVEKKRKEILETKEDFKKKNNPPPALKKTQYESLPEIKLNGLFAFKQGLSITYNEKREAIPVTYLKYEPCYVSQIKSKKKEGYDAIQVAFKPKSFKKSTKSQRGHFKKTNFEHAAQYVKEIKQSLPKEIHLGQRVALSSLSKGDHVKITSRSKGKGFSGVVKRWGFHGGPASHGSKFHRKPGSIGNCTEPSRVMPGRKMPGRHGFKNHTLNKVEVIDVIYKSNTLLLKGSIAGSRNTLVRILKVQ